MPLNTLDRRLCLQQLRANEPSVPTHPYASRWGSFEGGAFVLMLRCKWSGEDDEEMKCTQVLALFCTVVFAWSVW